MTRPRLAAAAIVLAALVCLAVWIASDPPRALRSALQVWLEARGVELRTWDASGVSGSYLEAGEGKGSPVVLLHGAGGDAFSTWFTLLPRLASEHHVVAPLLGYASLVAARPEPGKPVRWDHGGADRIGLELNGVLEAMAGAGIRRADVVGLSVGGWLALRLASRNPAAVSGVVAVAPAGPNLYGLVQRITASGREPGRWFFDNLFHRPPLLPEAFVRDQHSIIDAWVENLPHYAGVIEHGGDGAELTLRGVNCPVTLVWGREDRILPVSDAAMYQDLLASSRLLVLPDCGHAVVWDQPGELASIVDSFAKGERP